MRYVRVAQLTVVNLLLAMAPGCGDAGSNTPGETDSDGGSTGVTSGEASSSGMASSSGLPSSSTSDPTGSGTGSSSGGALDVDTEVITYPQQPMVVDVVFSQPGLDVTASVTNDPGVQISTLDDDAEGTRVRLRGLAPATVHALAWNVQSNDGAALDGETEILTETPLPGFVPSFEVDGDATGLGNYLLFDMTRIGVPGFSSMFVVDAQGTTRWHFGVENTMLDPSVVFAAAKPRPDGSTIFLRDYAISAVDELGEETFRLDSDTLGVEGLHHDFVVLDNGNFLTMTFVFADVEEPGGGTEYVVADSILEVTPKGEIVWEWNMFDHLDINRRPEGFEELVVNPQNGLAAKDWTHSNGLVYEPETDSVLVSVRHQDWLVRIDRSTDEIVWRLGFEGDFELTEGSWFWHQHSPQWQPDGSLLLYDNGLHDPGVPAEEESSRAVRYVLNEETMTVAQVWEDEEEPFMAPIAGDADRLEDGTYLVTDSSIDFTVGMPYARIRKVDEATPAAPDWTLLTEVGTFVYRCLPVSVLPGVPSER